MLLYACYFNLNERSFTVCHRNSTFAGRCAIISQQVAILHGPQEFGRRVASRRFSQRVPLAFCECVVHKRNRAISRGFPPRDYANESTQRGSTDGQSSALLPSGNHKPAAFSSSTKTRTDTTRSARLPCYLVHVGGGTATGGRAGTGVNQGSKYNRPEDMKNETEDRRRAIRQLRKATSQTRK